MAKFVMRNADLRQQWVRLLRRLQGMDRQVRVTGAHVEYDHEVYHEHIR